MIYGWWKHISNLHIRPQILTLTLLWQAISFQCTVLKRSRSDTLLDKDSAIATISSAWENRRTGIAVCLFLHVVSNITGRIFKKYQGKKTTADGPKTSRSIPTAQNMHNLLPFSEEHPQSKALPWSRANNKSHSCINCCQPHICRLDGSSPPSVVKYEHIKYLIGSDWVLMGTIANCTPGQVQHELPKPTRLRPGDVGDSSQLGTLLS